MPNWNYAVGNDLVARPTGTLGGTLDLATTSATSLLWNTGDNSTGYYTYRLTSDGTGVNIDNGQMSNVQKVDPEIKRKQFLQPRPELLIAKTPELNLFTPGDLLADSPASPRESKVDYDVLKPMGRYRDQHVYEVYEVPERPWDADPTHYEEGIEAKGLRKTSMGFYIQDDQVKYGFRRRKILELREPPAFIQSRHRLSDKRVSPQELIARELLRRYVGEKEFKRYRQFGYIMMAAHGFDWKVPGERATIHRIVQYKKSQALNSYCVHFEDTRIPPTDACVMRMALIWAGIDVLKKNANTASLYSEVAVGPVTHPPRPAITRLSLVDAFKKVREQYGSVGVLNG